MNHVPGRVAGVLLAWTRDAMHSCWPALVPAGWWLGALVVALFAGPAHSRDAQASAPVAATPPAATPAGLVQMPDGRLLAPEFARIVTRGQLVVAVLGVDQPPFFESRNGELAGVDIDLANEIAKKLGVAVRFNREAATFDGVVQLLAMGRADLAVSKLSRTLPRAQVIRFSTPYVSLKRALLLNRVRFAELARGRPVPEVVRDYDGTIGIVAGSAYADYVQTDFPKAQIRIYPSWSAVLDALNAGAVSATYRDELAIKRVMKEQPTAPIRLRVATLADLNDSLAIGVRVSDPTLLAFVNQFLEDRGRRFDVKSLLNATSH
ncbi:amino acid ABC transporter substrate-binding protein [Burkholderia ubonensis]|uniref:Amino acid ABC transporter substrate-binding protein n=2 Tax=Burkholderia ubonensis TaxID=101571 RepID=A0A103RKK1_9BURK|nr:ABC transporter substrate-binding protein [Burkholderia ubonensis]AOJ65602.1 amino acid ABC transporter substrate-binding protein [Burkholderia ubonensis]KVG69492.1 amino acid ABC transporter substrate-binding protein [Burkholderia ubonensis]